MSNRKTKNVEQKNNKFYSLDNIKKTGATYNVIFGERSNGKTYSVLYEGLKEYCLHGGQLAIVRRWKEDITGRRASDIFTALNSNNEVEKLTNGKYHGITYFASKFYLCNYDENGKPVYSLDNDCFAYTFALSETEHNKSISYPNITTILFDEFITKHIYLNDEFVLFMNTISTIVRQRTNVKIYMCGNTVNKFCPYFQEMGLTHILEMKQGTIDVYTYGDSTLKVAVEYCTNSQHRKENNFYFAFNNPKLNMITGGAWELDIYPHLPVKYQPKNIQFIYFIEFNGFLCQCEVVEINGEMFTFIHQKTTPLKDETNDLIYTLDFHYELNYNRNICKPQNTLQKRLLWFFETNRVFYQNNEIGDIINNYLKLCKGGIV